MGTIRNGAALAALLLLGGCLNFGPKAPDKLIALNAQASPPAGAALRGSVQDALIVLDPVAERRIDVQRIAVQVDESSVAYLKNAQWVERPTRQFRRLLAETIRARRPGRIVFEGSDSNVQGTVTLSGRLLDSGYDARRQAVVVRLDATRHDIGGTVEVRRFAAEVPGVAATGEAVGPALNKAANEVAQQVADWLG